jgi:hypothetical protein
MVRVVDEVAMARDHPAPPTVVKPALRRRLRSWLSGWAWRLVRIAS